MKVKRIDFLWICILIIVFLFSMAGLNVIERWNDTIIRNVNIEENKISKKVTHSILMMLCTIMEI